MVTFMLHIFQHSTEKEGVKTVELQISEVREKARPCKALSSSSQRKDTLPSLKDEEGNLEGMPMLGFEG